MCNKKANIYVNFMLTDFECIKIKMNFYIFFYEKARRHKGSNKKIMCKIPSKKIRSVRIVR